MVDDYEDPEGEVLPIKIEEPDLPHALTGIFKTPEAIRQRAEEFVVEWMAGAVQKSKHAIVATALNESREGFDPSELDKLIIDTISGWDFTRGKPIKTC